MNDPRIIAEKYNGDNKFANLEKTPQAQHQQGVQITQYLLSSHTHFDKQ